MKKGEERKEDKVTERSEEKVKKTVKEQTSIITKEELELLSKIKDQDLVSKAQAMRAIRYLAEEVEEYDEGDYEIGDLIAHFADAVDRVKIDFKKKASSSSASAMVACKDGSSTGKINRNWNREVYDLWEPSYDKKSRQ